MLKKKNMISEKEKCKAYRLLASRIISSAIEDWKEAQEELLKNPKNPKAQAMVSECEEFFVDPWYQDLRELAWDDFPRDLKKRLEEMIYGHQRIS